MAATGVIGTRDRIGAILLLQESLARVRRAALPLALLWLVAGTVFGGIDAYLNAVGLEAETVEFGVIGLSYNGVSAVLTGALSAVALRLLLGAPQSWRRVDRGYLEGAGLFAAMTFAFGLWALVPGDFAFSRLDILAGVIVALVGSAYVLARLMLWPTGRVMSVQRMTPTGSWRLMRGAMLGYLLANLLLVTPFLGLLVAAIPPSGETSPLVSGLLSAGFIGFSLLSMAATAVVYDLRVRAPESVGNVFA